MIFNTFNSQACAIFADIHGATSDECGVPYLLYAKSMIALGQQETKVLDVPSEGEEENEGGKYLNSISLLYVS